MKKTCHLTKNKTIFDVSGMQNISEYAQKSRICDIFVRVKPFAILDVLRNKGESHISEVAREASCNYSHTHKIILFFEEKGIIKLEKQGKIRKIILTEKGNQIAEQIMKIKEELE